MGYGGDALWGLCNNQDGGYIIDANFSNVFSRTFLLRKFDKISIE